MLKSLTTQFAATLFFGPLGLAYSSLAAAVFLTLLFAVIYFTGLGLMAALLIWPIAIITGLVFVKVHNDQIRSSGSRLLLGPGEEEAIVGTLGSWGRGVAVLSLMGVVSYLVLWYSPSDDSEKGDRMVDASPVENAGAGSQSATDSSLVGNVVDTDVLETTSGFTEVTIDQQVVTPVIVNTSSEPEPEPVDVTLLYVNSALVNLREGPGTNHQVLRQVERGDELTEVDRAGNWINVTTSDNGTNGWILGRLVRSEQ